MTTASIDEFENPNNALNENLELFRKEAESLNQLVDDLFEQLEKLNSRLGQKSAEVEQQRTNFEQREAEWTRKQGEAEDIREFFVHQNDQIAAAIAKLNDFEAKLGSDGGETLAGEEIKALIDELRAEQEGMRQSRDDAEERHRQEAEQWTASFAQQGEQLTQALEKLSAFEDKLQAVAPTAEGQVGDQLSGLLEQVQEQVTWLRERAESEVPSADSSSTTELTEHLSRQDDQLAAALDKLASFEQQLSNIAQAEPTGGEAPAVDFTELLEEIRSQREELRKQAEAERTQREAEAQSLQVFVDRHDEHFSESLSRLSSVESLIQNLPVAGAEGGGESSLEPRLNELIQELKTERDEFRERYETQFNESLSKISSVESMIQNLPVPSSEGGGDSSLEPRLNEIVEQLKADRDELRTRHDERFNESLSKLSDVESLIQNLSMSAPEGGGESLFEPRLNELIDQLKAERDEFRERFERASEEATRLAELVSNLASQDGVTDPNSTQVADALTSSEQARQMLDRDLAAANSRISELEKTISRQQLELKHEKDELREQLRDLRELLEMRSNFEGSHGESSAPASPAAGAGTQTMVVEQPSDRGEDQSVLAQFAKLSRK